MHYSAKVLFILVPLRTKMALTDWDVIVFLFFRGGRGGGVSFLLQKRPFLSCRIKTQSSTDSPVYSHSCRARVAFSTQSHLSICFHLALEQISVTGEGLQRGSHTDNKNNQTPHRYVETNKDTFPIIFAPIFKCVSICEVSGQCR